jgi:hypothetical protein
VSRSLGARETFAFDLNSVWQFVTIINCSLCISFYLRINGNDCAIEQALARVTRKGSKRLTQGR